MTISLRASSPWQRYVGVTMIELLMTLAVLAVLMTVAVPGLSRLIEENRRIANVNLLLGSLGMLRNEAIKRGARVTMCKTVDPDAVPVVCAPDAAWAQGWAIYVDNTHEPGNSLGVIDGTDILLRVARPDAGIVIATGANYARGVFYEPTGVSRGINASGLAALGTDTFRITSGGERLCVTVNGTGRPSVRKPGQPSCL